MVGNKILVKKTPSIVTVGLGWPIILKLAQYTQIEVETVTNNSVGVGETIWSMKPTIVRPIPRVHCSNSLFLQFFSAKSKYRSICLKKWSIKKKICSKYATENYWKLEYPRGTSFLSVVKKLPFNAFAKQPWLSLKEQSLPRLLSN